MLGFLADLCDFGLAALGNPSDQAKSVYDPVLQLVGAMSEGDKKALCEGMNLVYPVGDPSRTDNGNQTDAGLNDQGALLLLQLVVNSGAPPWKALQPGQVSEGGGAAGATRGDVAGAPGKDRPLWYTGNPYTHIPAIEWAKVFTWDAPAWRRVIESSTGISRDDPSPPWALLLRAAFGYSKDQLAFFDVLGPTLHANEVMKKRQALVSPNGVYTLLMQGDGNLVVYQGEIKNAGAPNPSGKVVWAANTQGNGEQAMFTADGYFAVLVGSKRTWQERGAAAPGGTVTMQDDGNLVVSGADGKAVWSSKGGAVPVHAAKAAPARPASPAAGGSTARALVQVAKAAASPSRGAAILRRSVSGFGALGAAVAGKVGPYLPLNVTDGVVGPAKPWNLQSVCDAGAYYPSRTSDWFKRDWAANDTYEGKLFKALCCMAASVKGRNQYTELARYDYLAALLFRNGNIIEQQGFSGPGTFDWVLTAATTVLPVAAAVVAGPAAAAFVGLVGKYADTFRSAAQGPGKTPGTRSRGTGAAKPSDGTALVGTKLGYYVMQGGFAVPFPDAITLEVVGRVAPDQAQKADDLDLQIWSEGAVPPPSVASQGAVFRRRSDNALFNVGGDWKLHLIPDAETAAALGVTGYRTVSDAAIAASPLGDPLPSQKPAAAATGAPADGTILKDQAGALYAVRGGVARRFPDTVTVEVVTGFRIADVASQATAASYDDLARWSAGAAPFPSAVVEGAFFQETGGDYFVVKGGRRHLVPPNAATFAAVGMTGQPPRISPDAANTIPEGDPIPDATPAAPPATTTPGTVTVPGPSYVPGGGGGGALPGRTFFDTDGGAAITPPGWRPTVPPPAVKEAGVLDYFRENPVVALGVLSALGSAVAWYVSRREHREEIALVRGGGSAPASYAPPQFQGYRHRRRRRR